MKNGITEIVFILDKSGSMSGLESDTIGGFNSMLKKQRKEDGKAFCTTILFSNKSEIIHDRVELTEVPEMTEEDYVVGGCTALIDAIGDAITHITKIHKYARKEDVPERCLFVIITDGYENASSKYSSDEVKKMIERKKEEGWEFLFLGADIDAVQTAKTFGIAEERAVSFRSTGKGHRRSYATLGAAIPAFMRKGKIDDSWSDDIKKHSDED